MLTGPDRQPFEIIDLPGIYSLVPKSLDEQIAVDILTGTLLGQHAFSLSVVGFLTVKTHKRVRVFPLWQQSVFVVLLLLLERLLFFWVDGTIGRPAKGTESWIAPLLGGLIWPWLFIVMRDLRRRFHAS